MAIEKNITEALDTASLSLGKAWGLADTLRAVIVDRQDPFDVESILRVVCRFTSSALADVKGTAENTRKPVEEAFAVCELAMVDSQEVVYTVNCPSMWTLETLPDLLHRAKEAVDNAADAA